MPVSRWGELAVTVTIRGLDKLQKRLSDPEWVQKPAGTFLQQWLEFVKREAAANAPGGIGRTIQGERDSRRFPLWARVFSDHPGAGPLEWGTGLLSEAPDSKHTRHYPPARALEGWARARGLNPYAVARAIGNRGGLAPRRFFRNAEKAADAQLNAWLAQFAAGIEREADYGA